MRRVRLGNGVEESADLVEGVMGTLRDIERRGPQDRALILRAAWMAQPNSKYVPDPSDLERLQNFGLLEADGSMSNLVKSVIWSAIQIDGDDTGFTLRSPVVAAFRAPPSLRLVS